MDGWIFERCWKFFCNNNSPVPAHRWFRHISEAADAYKHKDSFGRNRRVVDPSAPLPQSPPDTESAAYESPEKTKEPDDSHDSDRIKDGNDLDTSGTSQEGGDSNQSNDSTHKQQSTLSTSHPSPSAISPETSEHGRKSVDSSPSQRRKVEQVRLSTVTNSLVQPSEVVVSLKPVLTAEPVLTPLEQIRVKDEEIRKALLAKQQLVADILHVPKEEFQTIAEMAGEPSVDREAAELVLAAVNQANELAAAVNEALKVTDEEAVTYTSEVMPGYSTRGGRRKTRLPGVPAQKLQGISNSLNYQLTQLLKIVKERDEEREMLRKELQKCREQIHVLHETHRDSQKSPSHSRSNEEGGGGDEFGEIAREPVTDSNDNDNEDEGNITRYNHDTQDSNPENLEVFVDALSGDMEVLEAQSEASETEEEPPV
ncbi:conserved hypothetical protein [Pediculus humanus corporis]|uniref:Uncharacterized protein n=1 Tax=Pediculus humanus subsp. corporis TaxID=121224 RepID=E0VFR9_PEDHC|nr:uncharacterized protein Phum_PHUM165170 [Pediculus humanus corporis]EEB12225.1 conserved hypothetical protein [Pediculus humanus corporis]